MHPVHPPAYAPAYTFAYVSAHKPEAIKNICNTTAISSQTDCFYQLLSYGTGDEFLVTSSLGAVARREYLGDVLVQGN